LILNFGAPHREIDTAEPQECTRRDGAWIVGLHDRYRLSEAVGARDFMVVRLTPLGAHHFLQAPMHLIRGRSVELSALDPKLAGLVMSRVGAARSWDERFATMEALITERVAQATAPSGIAAAWGKLEAADGRLPLGALASEIGCSHRALITQFRTCIGVSPKAAGRLLRFNRVLRALNRLSRNRCGESGSKPYIEALTPDNRSSFAVSWADIAADCGYSDQSHFIKEFSQFAGATPTEFMRRVSDVA